MLESLIPGSISPRATFCSTQMRFNDQENKEEKKTENENQSAEETMTEVEKQLKVIKYSIRV